MGFVGVVVQVQLMAITGMVILSSPTTANQLGLPGCEIKCGDVVVPYPFGMTDGCYLDTIFHVRCNNSNSPPTLILGENLLIKNISIKDHEISIMVGVARKCYEFGKVIYSYRPRLWAGKFTISNTKNKFFVMGCDSYAYLYHENIYMGCTSKCQSIDEVPNDESCSGIGCCHINEIPKGLKNISVEVRSYNNHTSVNNFNNCSYALLAEDKKFKFSRQYLNNFTDNMVPLVLEWAIDNDTCLHRQNLSCPCGKNSKREYFFDWSYNCICIPGYQGNPYLPGGCQDINECKYSYPNKCPTYMECVNTEGSYNCKQKKKDPQIYLKLIIAISSALGASLLLFFAWGLYKIIKKRIDDQRKERFFKRNGGLLLQQQLSSKEVNVETIKLFKFEELDKATDHFSVDRILGQGGQGTVYKGMLADGKIVAIKKSKLENNEEGTISESKRSEFINEVVILSQIKHRNVVNLMGCCLESEVPLLVYEFILNGTLYQYIHDNQNEEFPLTWEVRLRIALEIGSALSYLHSSTSFPIYHRDIKSSNILLDEKYRAKIADFGTSRSINIEQTHLTTQVKGTFGYLDPEYFQSSQFTEKSDVYSFGVVMVELLTGQKPISRTRSEHREESRSLATYFILCMERNRLCDIVDSRIINDGGSQDQIIKVAHLAKRCLNLNGKHRPTMREVAMELEEIQKCSKTCVNMQSFTQHVGNEEAESLWDANSSLLCSSSFGATTSSLDALPLLKTK